MPTLRTLHNPIAAWRRLWTAGACLTLAAAVAAWAPPALARVTEVTVSSTPVSGSTYRLGETIRFTVTFDEAVTVTGAPTLAIDMDPAYWGTKQASYEGGSGTRTLTFAHTVSSPNFSSQGIAVLANSLRLNGQTLSHAGLGHDANHRVDWRLAPLAPSVTGVAVSSAPASGNTYRLGETIRLTVTFDEAVTVTGASTLAIDMDPAYWGTKQASYEGGSGTRTLTFVHTVTNPNFSSQGIAVLANSLRLNGQTLSHAGLGHDADHRVDWQLAAFQPPTSEFGIDSSDGADVVETLLESLDNDSELKPLLEGHVLSYDGSADGAAGVRGRLGLPASGTDFSDATGLLGVLAKGIEVLFGRGTTRGNGAGWDFPSETKVFANWVDGVFFGTAFDRNERSIAPFVVGVPSGVNPAGVDGTAVWTGSVTGRELDPIGHLSGNATLTYDFRDTNLDVLFDQLRYYKWGYPEPRIDVGDMTWDDLSVSNGSFGNCSTSGNCIRGRFFDDDEGNAAESVGGVFRHGEFRGAFGAERN